MTDDLNSSGITVRLAKNQDEVTAAQKLRYHVFYDEFGAKPTPEMAAQKRDFDYFDDFTDHLVVIDPNAEFDAGVVGTYRLLHEDAAKRAGRFYTSTEYNIDPLIASGAKMVEVGRSCVLAEYRTMPVLQLLWSGIASYISEHQIDLMFGCASLHGTDPAVLAPQLSLLYHNNLATPELRPRALPERYVDMNMMPRDQINARKVFMDLPPLIKGYLRVGAMVGDGAVVDEQFNTTDVCIIMPTYMVNDRYVKHYERELAQPISRNVITGGAIGTPDEE